MRRFDRMQPQFVVYLLMVLGLGIVRCRSGRTDVSRNLPRLDWTEVLLHTHGLLSRFLVYIIGKVFAIYLPISTLCLLTHGVPSDYVGCVYVLGHDG